MDRRDSSTKGQSEPKEPSSYFDKEAHGPRGQFAAPQIETGSYPRYPRHKGPHGHGGHALRRKHRFIIQSTYAAKRPQGPKGPFPWSPRHQKQLQHLLAYQRCQNPTRNTCFGEMATHWKTMLHLCEIMSGMGKEVAIKVGMSRVGSSEREDGLRQRTIHI